MLIIMGVKAQAQQSRMRVFVVLWEHVMGLGSEDVKLSRLG